MKRMQLLRWRDVSYALPAFVAGAILYLRVSSYGYEWMMIVGYVGTILGFSYTVMWVAYFIMMLYSLLSWGTLAGIGCLFAIAMVRVIALKRHGS
jgi:hypothetical protein